MADISRHALSMRQRPRMADARTRTGPGLYRGARSRNALRDIYTSDHGEIRHGGRFRWLLSTCIAATVGALAIIVIIYGSADPKESGEGLLPALKRMSEATAPTPIESMLHRTQGLNWAVPRGDRLQIMTGAMSTRFTIHETLKQKRGGREYIYAKPYLRMVLRLAPVPANYADVIPPFNPFKLYANSQPIGSGEDGRTLDQPSDVSIKVVELLGGILPGEDGQELDNQEVADLVARSQADEDLAGVPAPEAISQPAAGETKVTAAGDTADAQHSTTLAKTVLGSDDNADDLEGLKRIVKTVGEGDTLTKILVAAGAETWLAKSMLEAAKPVLADSAVVPGQEVHIVLAPSLTKQNAMEPVRFSVFDDGHAHKLTVMRNAAGEFVASATPIDEEATLRAALSDSDTPQPSSLYASFYAAALVQQVPPETIMRVLRTFAYETDFRRRVRPGDTVELFFDLKDELTTDGPPGDLLYAAITTGGESKHFYRFRAADGSVDFYDDDGNNSRKFLIRKPVRGEDVRLTSGFGMRRHPLLGEYKMHTGIDWSTPIGTPILAAGNGSIEEVGRKGYNGNYIRIRHANGYQTAYSHLSRFADGAEQGAKVKQGQVIGYVGSTGLSSGPHLHFEVLVNNQFVDPLSIQVPRERQLKDKDQVEFQKERARLDDLKARAPVAMSSK